MESTKEINKAKSGLEKMKWGETTHFLYHELQNSQTLFP